MTQKAEKIVINIEKCKGCGLCVFACDKKILSMSQKINKKGIHYVEFKDLMDCKSCTMCAIICPDVCIEVYREVTSNQ